MTSLAPLRLVSVIILNYNGAHHLPTCIESLQAQTLADQLEIIVADNGSTYDNEQVGGRPIRCPAFHRQPVMLELI